MRLIDYIYRKRIIRILKKNGFHEIKIPASAIKMCGDILDLN